MLNFTVNNTQTKFTIVSSRNEAFQPKEMIQITQQIATYINALEDQKLQQLFSRQIRNYNLEQLKNLKQDFTKLHQIYTELMEKSKNTVDCIHYYIKLINYSIDLDVSHYKVNFLYLYSSL